MLRAKTDDSSHFLLDYLISVKIFGRSAERTNRAQQMIREFEEKNYSSRRIHRNDMDLLSGRDVRAIDWISSAIFIFIIDL